MLISQFTLNIRSREDSISPLNDFTTVIEGLINSLLFVSALLVLGYMLWGAFDWVTAGGDSGKIENARKKITQSIIGLAVLASVGAIFLVVQWMLGIEVLTTSGGTPTCVGSACLTP